MYAVLLDMIVKYGIHTEIKGITSTRTEKTLIQNSHLPGLYQQGNAMFTDDLVDNILFHSNGCTIVLKH